MIFKVTQVRTQMVKLQAPLELQEFVMDVRCFEISSCHDFLTGPRSCYNMKHRCGLYIRQYGAIGFSGSCE